MMDGQVTQYTSGKSCEAYSGKGVQIMFRVFADLVIVVTWVANGVEIVLAHFPSDGTWDVYGYT